MGEVVQLLLGHVRVLVVGRRLFGLGLVVVEGRLERSLGKILVIHCAGSGLRRSVRPGFRVGFGGAAATYRSVEVSWSKVMMSFQKCGTEGEGMCGRWRLMYFESRMGVTSGSVRYIGKKVESVSGREKQ